MDTKGIKSKKAAAKPKKSPPSHPTYLEMIGEAIGSLKERSGSSQVAIAKFIEDKHKEYHLPPNFKKLLSVQLKKLIASGKLTKIKNSYKLTAPAKNSKPAKVSAKPKAKVAAKPKAKVAAKPNAKVAAKPKAKVSAKPKAKVSAKPKAKVAAKPKAKLVAKPKAKVAAKKAVKASPAKKRSKTVKSPAKKATAKKGKK